MFPESNRKVVGKCSICGGVVSVPTVIWSVVPPVPTCESCGAVMDQTANLPTVPMRPVRRSLPRANVRWTDTRVTEIKRRGSYLVSSGMSLLHELEN